MAIDVSKFGKGGLLRDLSVKDYRFELLPQAPTLPEEYEIKFEGKIKNQGTSSSCVSQAVSYYAEVLNYLETKSWVSLSPRYLYSAVWQKPYGGSYTKDNMAIVCNKGIAPEENVPSYKQGQPPDEEFMRQKDDIDIFDDYAALTYVSEKYFTWDNTNIDLYKQAILRGNGCVAICWGNNYLWQNARILLPDNRQQLNWLHGVYFVGWNDKKREFKFLNSWGENWGDNGFGYLPYEYIERGYVGNPMTMVDLPNDFVISKLSIIKNLLIKIIEILKGRQK